LKVLNKRDGFDGEEEIQVKWSDSSANSV